MAESDLQLIERLVKEAGEIALRYYKSDNEVWYKSGNSPVSEADKAIDTMLRETFASERPDYGWLSEETADNAARLQNSTVVIADPIDGTRGFIAGRPEWCISVAIVKNQRPVAGILHCPALERTFLASTGQGATLNGSNLTEPQDPEKLATGSKKLIELMRNAPDFDYPVMEFIPSLAYRLAMVTTGELAVAFARSGASEWDLAAADIILQEAGCSLTDQNGEPVLYNKEKVSAPGLIASTNRGHKHHLELAKRFSILQ